MSLNTRFSPHLVAIPSSSSPGQKKVFANGQTTNPISPHATVIHHGIGFCSLSEAVCGTLLEIFVPGYEVKEGLTFQVPLGQGSSIDFLVGDVFLEYHGLRFYAERGRYGDFKCRQEYAHYNRQLRRVRRNPWKRKDLINQTRIQLRDNYFQKRRRLIDSCPEHCDRELIVATSSEEFYDLVIRRFNRQFCPTRVEFREIFYALVKAIAKDNPLANSRERLRA